MKKNPSTVADLTPNERNPRLISEERLKLLQRSLNEFGDLGGFIFNRTTGRVVGAHQRRKTMPDDCRIVTTKDYSKPTKRGTVLEGYIEFDGERFSYREVAWSKKKEATAMVAANKHGGEFDQQALVELLQEFSIDAELAGLTEMDMVKLLKKTTLSNDEFSVITPQKNSDNKCPKCGYSWSGSKV